MALFAVLWSNFPKQGSHWHLLDPQQLGLMYGPMAFTTPLDTPALHTYTGTQHIFTDIAKAASVW